MYAMDNVAERTAAFAVRYGPGCQWSRAWRRSNAAVPPRPNREPPRRTAKASITFSGLPSTYYELTITKEGFDTVIRNFTLGSNTEPMDVTLAVGAPFHGGYRNGCGRQSHGIAA